MLVVVSSATPRLSRTTSHRRTRSGDLPPFAAVRASDACRDVRRGGLNSAPWARSRWRSSCDALDLDGSRRTPSVVAGSIRAQAAHQSSLTASAIRREAAPRAASQPVVVPAASTAAHSSASRAHGTARSIVQ